MAPRQRILTRSAICNLPLPLFPELFGLAPGPLPTSSAKSSDLSMPSQKCRIAGPFCAAQDGGLGAVCVRVA
eukprot:6210167-Pleurochrysis_carterae.AAC.5